MTNNIKLTFEKINIQSIVAIAVPYLVICGGIYHIGYWVNFRINGLALISLVDIAKSSFYQFSFFFLAIFLFLFLFLLFDYRDNAKGKTEFEFVSGPALWMGWGMLGSSLLTLFLNSTSRFIVFGLLWAMCLPLVISQSRLIKNNLPDVRIRILFVTLFFSVPFYAFFSGFSDGYYVKSNFKFEYIVSKEIKQKIQTTYPNVYVSDTMKILGMTDKYIVFSDLHNWRKIYIKNDNIDTLIIRRGRIWKGVFVNRDGR